MRIKIITAFMDRLEDGSYNVASLGSKLTTAANEWIESNTKYIYKVESIKTVLFGKYGMVTIQYYLKGFLV